MDEDQQDHEQGIGGRKKEEQLRVRVSVYLIFGVPSCTLYMFLCVLVNVPVLIVFIHVSSVPKSMCLCVQVPVPFPAMCLCVQVPVPFPAVCLCVQVPIPFPAVCLCVQVPFPFPAMCLCVRVPVPFPAMCLCVQVPVHPVLHDVADQHGVVHLCLAPLPRQGGQRRRGDPGHQLRSS